ncbi:class II fructose-bisphosphate aldolase [Candidatus Uhrbacteria bacterium]|nr:class II fructose-bisphosphate aldolase [Candidatus Uhrbacteria bacterium]
MSLHSTLIRAAKEKWAVPHFNVGDFEQFRGVCEAAAKLRAPVMIGTSEGERDFLGLPQSVALVKAFRDQLHLPIFLNADHTRSVRAAKAAIDAGYDSIHIDLSREPWNTNLKGTREIVRYAREKCKRKNVKCKISVEGELGYIVTESSKVYKKKILVDPSTFTKPEEAKKFVRLTGVDRFAPAVGNLHGIAANKPKLDFVLIKKLRGIIPMNVALVLHGGSGNSPAAFKKAIKLGINNIHISTELRIAYVKSEHASLHRQKNELAPYKLAAPVVEAVRKKAEYFIRLFGAYNKA